MALQYDGANARVFVNGTVKGTSTATGALKFGASRNLAIGTTLDWYDPIC